MMDNFARSLWNALVEAYHELSALMTVNFLWLLLTLPIVTAPAAIAGLYYATYQLALGKPVSARTFFEGFRQYAWHGYRFFILNFVIILGLAFNIYFYAHIQSYLGSMLQGVTIFFTVTWLLVQVYAFPLLFEQEDQRLRTAWRNSLVLWLKWPGFGLLLAAILLTLAVLSSVLILPWLLFTVALLAYLANCSVLALVTQLRAEK